MFWKFDVLYLPSGEQVQRNKLINQRRGHRRQQSARSNMIGWCQIFDMTKIQNNPSNVFTEWVKMKVVK